MGRRTQGLRLVAGRRPTDPLYVRFTYLGRRRYLSTGTRDPRVATERAAAIYSQVVAGRFGAPVAWSKALPVDEHAACYLEQLEATGSHERFAMQLVHFRAHILPRFTHLSQLADEAAWTDYIAARARAGVSNGTIAKELSTLRCFAKWCRARRMIEDVPEVHAPRRKSDYRPLCLSPAQIEAVLAALPETVPRGPAHGRPIRARHILGWETGLRPATLARLRVEDYDRSNKRLSIRDSIDKARFGREVPLSERAWMTLESVLPKRGLIFGTARAGNTLKAAARAAGLPDSVATRFRAYTFRHSRITQFASASADLRGIAYLAGHRNLVTTSRYVHGDLHAAARVLEAVATAPERWTPAGNGSTDRQ